MSGLDRMREICQRNADGGPMRREGRAVNDKRPPTQRALPGIPLTPDVQIELWIAERIGKPDLFAGVTTREQRRERIRLALLPISDHIAGKGKSGQPESWSTLYKRIFGRSLETETQRGAT